MLKRGILTAFWRRFGKTDARYNTVEVINMYGMYQPINPMAYRQQMNSQPFSQPYMQAYGQQQSAVIKGRIVTGMEEARAAQIDLDGSVSVFPSPSENKIYTKTIDINGNPVFEVYQKAMPQEAKAPVYADSEAVAALQQRVEQLEMMIQGVVRNDESLSVGAGPASKPKSRTVD